MDSCDYSMRTIILFFSMCKQIKNKTMTGLG